MNRLLSISALLLSLCALLVTLLLWREMRAWRLEAASLPVQYRLTDEQFGQIKEFAGYIHTWFDEGHVPRAEVLTADQLLNKARYMHGDITREEWHRLQNATEAERMHLDLLRLQAGAGSIAETQLLLDDVLESSR